MSKCKKSKKKYLPSGLLPFRSLPQSLNFFVVATLIITFGLFVSQGLSSPTDIDGDGIVDEYDNCPEDFNPEQRDADGDGQGDVCDPYPLDPTDTDTDEDGVDDTHDNCPDDANPDQADVDSDGAGDAGEN